MSQRRPRMTAKVARGIEWAAVWAEAALEHAEWEEDAAMEEGLGDKALQAEYADARRALEYIRDLAAWYTGRLRDRGQL